MTNNKSNFHFKTRKNIKFQLQFTILQNDMTIR